MNRQQALSLEWTFGFNHTVSASVHDLSNDNCNAVFYITSNIGVIYDYVSRTQRILRGHGNSISCSVVDPTRKFIYTAERGEDSLIIVWDSQSGNPVQMISNPHEFGVYSIDVSPDARFLVSLSGEDSQGIQEVAVWDLHGDCEEALFRSKCKPMTTNSVSAKKPGRDKKNSARGPSSEKFATLEHVRFDADNTYEFVTTGKHHLSFWSWRNNALVSQTPQVFEKFEEGQKLGKLCHSVYSGGIPMTSTAEGNVIVWSDATDDTGVPKRKGELLNKFPIKVIALSKGNAITYFTLHKKLLVTGTQDGHVRMYDPEFRLVAWYEDINKGPVKSISFSGANNTYSVENPLNQTVTNGNNFPPYEIANYVIGTSTGVVVSMDAACFDSVDSQYSHGTVLFQALSTEVVALCTHPSAHVFFSLCQNGSLQAWNYQTRQIIQSKLLHPEDIPESMAISNDGNFLAVGCKNGMMKIFRWGSIGDLGELACFHVRKNVSLTKLAFSPRDNFVGFCDAQNAVGLYRFIGEIAELDQMKVDNGKRKGEAGPGLEPCDGSESRNGWLFIGRCICHLQQVSDIKFGISASRKLQFISVGVDGYLAEYDLKKSSVVDGIHLAGPPARLEHHGTAITGCLFNPSVGSLYDDFIITANSDLKLKYISNQEKQCRKTVLGPVFGGALKNLCMVNGKDRDQLCIAYATNFRIIGLAMLPLDGNPHKHIGLIAHSDEISDLLVSFDSRFLLSAGGSDATVNIWAVDSIALDQSAAEAAEVPMHGVPKAIVPYVSLIEGGHEGKFYQDLIDLFYYSQLRCTGEDSTQPREVRGEIPLSEVPNTLRALGYYPTEHEIQNIFDEVQFSIPHNESKSECMVSFEQFTKLFLNHRPVQGVSLDQLGDAFNKLSAATAGNAKNIELKHLLDALHERGNGIPTEDLEKYVKLLIGKDAKELTDSGFTVDAEYFIHELLGFQNS